MSLHTQHDKLGRSRSPTMPAVVYGTVRSVPVRGYIRNFSAHAHARASSQFATSTIRECLAFLVSGSDPTM